MEIKKISLIDNGFKGLTVEYSNPDSKDGRDKFRILKEKIQHPIHLGLEKPFKYLRFHLLSICGLVTSDMDQKDVNYLIDQTEVIALAIDGSNFKIKGNKEYSGDKNFPLETPVIGEEDGYENYASVCVLIGTILEEVKAYMKGESKVSDEELVERWVEAGKQKGFDADSFNALSAEDKKEMCQRILEETFGMVVMGGDDFTVEHISTEEITNDFKQEIDMSEDTIVIDMKQEFLTALPEPVKLMK